MHVFTGVRNHYIYCAKQEVQWKKWPLLKYFQFKLRIHCHETFRAQKMQASPRQKWPERCLKLLLKISSCQSTCKRSTSPQPLMILTCTGSTTQKKKRFCVACKCETQHQRERNRPIGNKHIAHKRKSSFLPVAKTDLNHNEVYFGNNSFFSL